MGNAGGLKNKSKAEKNPARCTGHYIRTQGVDIGHRDSAIRPQSVTEGCDRRGNREGLRGQ